MRCPQVGQSAFLPYACGFLTGCAFSLYVTNLPSAKIKKPDLRTALYLLFSTYGPVLDIVVLKTMKMRGQAHIVYRDIQTATQAMRALNGSEFLGMHMVRPAELPSPAPR